MAQFSQMVITNLGQELIAKMIVGKGKMEFTSVSASDHAYTLDQVQGLRELEGVRQTSLISKIEQTNKACVKVEAAFTNVSLTAGYYMRAFGLYAVDPDAGEILYAVTVEQTGNCYMPPYNGLSTSGAYVKLVTTIGNAENISLEVDPAAVATIGDMLKLKKQIKSIEDNTNGTNDRYDETIPYRAGDYCTHENILYRCVAPTEGEWNSDCWQQTSILRELDYIAESIMSKAANNLLTTEEGYLLDARQGKVLNDKINALEERINKLSANGAITDMQIVDALPADAADHPTTFYWVKG